MSKYVKYISSEHFGAPVLKGDRWGYCVEMLRTCLVSGFNERTDLVKFEVLTNETVKYTFTDNHNYSEHQTIKITGTPYQELNDEVFILSVTPKEVIVKSYNDLTGIISQTNSITAKAIVAPLGFIEKFKDGNRSAFTTDEEKAFFYIDDTKPDNWDANATNTQLICPIVYMTDKMTDINTDGKYIFPYDPQNPTQYKKRGGTLANQQRNGIMNFISYGNHAAAGNSAANRVIPTKYIIVGNGRLFYFIPELLTANSTYLISTPIFGFGKYSSVNNIKDNAHVLFANNFIGTGTTLIQGVYDYSRVSIGRNKAITNTTGIITENGYINTIDSNKCPYGILKTDSKPSDVIFTPNYCLNGYSYTSIGLVSGISTIYQYPDINTNKFILSKIKMSNSKKYLGTLSGIMWVINGNNSFNLNGVVYKYKQNNKDKFLYCYNNVLSSSGNNSSIDKFIYMFSLDYKEWMNYE